VVVALTAATLLLPACGWDPPSEPSAAGGPVSLAARPVVTDLAFPAAFTFDPGGRIFYGERYSGRIRIYDPKTRQDGPFFGIPHVAGDGEQGLLGLALHPDYPAAPYVYAYATRIVAGQRRNQIVRITDAGGRGTDMRVIFSSKTVAGVYHDGGRILFGPDGFLYAVVGEAHSSANAQSLDNQAGKILRMTPAGKPAPGNPFGNLIWAYGIRNSYGFAFDPRTGRLWETENGPECNDELNRIIEGRNYGWGRHETCSTPPAPPRNTNRDGPDPVLPKLWYTPTIAPTGAAFCDGCGLGSTSEGRLFFGAYNTGEIRRVRLTDARLGVEGQTVVLRHDRGVLSMEADPNGILYFSDSTAIYKLVPA